ncbi:MAG: tagatose 1,6-diphosphate aldolase [Deltaproteobacteria bacterium]|nr:tagatose 1,6-diphosphate aldolase [Deltaproteobacteria bacterium]
MATMNKVKFDNMLAVSTQAGIIAAAAMDQRGSLKKSIAKEKGIDPKEVTDQQMTEFKTAVSKVLSPYASAMLLDPVWGLPATKVRAKGCGLLLAYEASGYDNTQPGRLPDLLGNWSVRRLKDAGANCCKILLYYTPFDPAKINEQKHAWVERIGAECDAEGLPFFLEFVGYAHDGADEKTTEFAKRKPEIVRRSMAEFNKPQYRVDVMKVEVPVNMQFVEGTKSFANKGVAYTKKEAMEHFRAAAKVCTKPFIYLSAGVSDAEFREGLELAIEAGVVFNGVLCGRATWKEGIPVYAKEGIGELERWLGDRGVQNIQALNAILERGAAPWWDVYGGKGKIHF